MLSRDAVLSATILAKPTKSPSLISCVPGFMGYCVVDPPDDKVKGIRVRVFNTVAEAQESTGDRFPLSRTI
jgi:hypothetical protein